MKLESLKEKLCKYGNIEIIKEGAVFTVFLTGQGLTGWSAVNEIQNIVLEYTGERFPLIEAIKNDETFFCLILKPRLESPSLSIQEAAEKYAGEHADYPSDLWSMLKQAFTKGWHLSNNQEGWVRVEDRLPEDGQVLGCMKDTRSIYVCYYRRTRGFEVWGLGREQPITDMKVTHWMPLPKPPIQK